MNGVAAFPQTGKARDMGPDLLLHVVVATALAFDFTNGFHDTANAMATSIAALVAAGADAVNGEGRSSTRSATASPGSSRRRASPRRRPARP